jgi:uncharacterized delta-60 repeat protein
MVKTVIQTKTISQSIRMKNSTLLLVAALAAWSGRASANDINYQTGFEPPGFTAGQPIRNLEGWESFQFLPASEAVISTDNPRDGLQSLRLKGVRNFCRRSIAADTTANPPMRIELRVDARLDGPQTGTLGTPEQDILSANFGVNILLPNGNSLLLGGYFVSSAGKIWTYTAGPRGAVYGYSVPATLGAYHSLLLRVDFFTRTVTFAVDGVELGSSPFPEAAALSEHLANGWVELAGSSTPINTPDITYDPANYTAYFDNYSVEAVTLTPADTDVRFAATDYAGSESGGPVNVTVARRGYTDSPVSVMLDTADGSATAGQDYLVVSKKIDFAPGEREKVVQIPVLNDRLAEADEAVTLSLTAVTPGLSISRASAPLWILDDERAGSVDPAFGFDTSALGLAVVYEVPSLVGLPTGKFLAHVVGEDDAGSFVGLLARFNGDGSRDSAFTPYPVFPIGGPAQVIPVLGGLMTLVNHGDRLARLNCLGREDATFKVSVAGGYGFIVDVEVQPDQKIVLAGSFEEVNGVPCRNIARVRITGRVDTTFNPGESTDDLIWDVARQPDGKLVIAGWFQNVAGQPRPLLARLIANGSLDAGFDPGAGFGDSFNGFQELTSVAVQSNGRIIVGGFFDSYQGATHNSLVGLRPDGSIDDTFDVGTGIASSGHLFFPDVIHPGRVANLALQPDGKLVVVGSWVYVNGVFAPGAVRLNSDGALDPAFRLGGTDSLAVPPFTYIGPVRAGPALALMPDGDILTTTVQSRRGIKTEPVSYDLVVRLNGDPFRWCKPSEK